MLTSLFSFISVCFDALDNLKLQEALTHAAEVVAGLWNVLPSKAVELAITRRPEFVIEDDYLKIGRVTLPRLDQVCDGLITAGCTCIAARHDVVLLYIVRG